MSWAAILWPAGTVTAARIFSLMISVPVGNSTLAITTSSAGLRRMVRSAACNIGSLLGRHRPAEVGKLLGLVRKGSFYAAGHGLGEGPFRPSVAVHGRDSMPAPGGAARNAFRKSNNTSDGFAAGRPVFREF